MAKNQKTIAFLMEHYNAALGSERDDQNLLNTARAVREAGMAVTVSDKEKLDESIGNLIRCRMRSTARKNDLIAMLMEQGLTRADIEK